ncbi:hypothetical protein A5626_01705 [Mycobacterium marseillense]|uniref:hypothetical protein n=1 Tax=Mycobacterium marseillense TaxID=701042 RepID=UPI0007FCCE24|nr:hypothetical protein [Mycobacterium marseillense]MCA2265182.1 hypothetical protein [Mycobacterium marseillense]OBJ75024.1 hypothetical protein A5626_01705 [Mycobacterium marseillense]
MEFQLLMEKPVPVWLLEGNSKPNVSVGRREALYPHLEGVMLADRMPVFRGVHIDRFLTVMTTGVDVEPTNAPIYCSDFEKAWEYGGPSHCHGPRMMFALHQGQLEKTFRVLPMDATVSEIAEVRRTYPHQHHEHPDALWFSRIDFYKPAYEAPYGYWIPGNAKDALMAVFLHGAERGEILAALDAALHRGSEAEARTEIQK